MLPKGNPFKRISKEMRMFLLKLVSLLVIWESLYIYVLKPVRIPDKLITTILTAAVTACLNIVSKVHHTWIHEPGSASCLIQKAGQTILVIFDGCNGLDLFLIYAAFIIILPYPAKRKWIFSFLGFVAIFVGNILRCLSLYAVYTYSRGMFEFNHHYVFTIIMYLIIFFGWVLYTKKPKRNEIG